MKTLVLLSAFVSATASAAGVNFGFANKNAMVINSTASSCTQMIGAQMSNRLPLHDISSSYFSIMKPQISLVGATGEKAWIFRISVVLKTNGIAGGAYRCEIAGEELGWAFAKSPAAPWNGELSDSQPVVDVNPTCLSLRCGGLEILPDSAFRTPATVSVDGYIVDADGNETPFTVKSTLNIENRL